MDRDEYDDRDDDYGEQKASGEDHFDDPESHEEDDDKDEDSVPASGLSTGEHDVDISMEIDEDGNEVWSAKDSKVPGSTSKGHSVEEAMEGVDDRRREFREMLKRSREKRDIDEDGEE